MRYRTGENSSVFKGFRLLVQCPFSLRFSEANGIQEVTGSIPVISTKALIFLENQGFFFGVWKPPAMQVEIPIKALASSLERSE